MATLAGISKKVIGAAKTTAKTSVSIAGSSVAIAGKAAAYVPVKWANAQLSDHNIRMHLPEPNLFGHGWHSGGYGGRYGFRGRNPYYGRFGGIGRPTIGRGSSTNLGPFTRQFTRRLLVLTNVMQQGQNQFNRRLSSLNKTIGGVHKGLSVLGRNIFTVSNEISQMSTSILGGLSKLQGSINNVLKGIVDVNVTLQSIKKDLDWGFNGVTNAINNNTKVLSAQIQNLVSVMAQANGSGVQRAIRGNKANRVSSAVTTSTTPSKSFSIIDAIIGGLMGLFAFGGPIMSGLGKVITGIISGIETALIGVMKKVAAPFEAAWKAIQETTVKLLEGAGKSLESAWNGLKGVADNLINKTEGFIKSFVSGAQDFIGKIAKSVEDFGSKIAGFVEGIPGKIKGAVQEGFEGITKWLRGAVEAALPKIPPIAPPPPETSLKPPPTQARDAKGNFTSEKVKGYEENPLEKKATEEKAKKPKFRGRGAQAAAEEAINKPSFTSKSLRGALKWANPLVIGGFEAWDAASAIEKLDEMKKNGEIKNDEYNTMYENIIKRGVIKTGTTWGGMELGAMGGAAIGSFLGPGGTIVGGVLGGIGGAVGGSWVGDKISDKVNKKNTKDDNIRFYGPAGNVQKIIPKQNKSNENIIKRGPEMKQQNSNKPVIVPVPSNPISSGPQASAQPTKSRSSVGSATLSFSSIHTKMMASQFDILPG